MTDDIPIHPQAEDLGCQDVAALPAVGAVLQVEVGVRLPLVEAEAEVSPAEVVVWIILALRCYYEREADHCPS